MAETQLIRIENRTARDKIIVALDVETAAEAKRLIDEIGDAVGAYKIGLQLFTAAGAKFVEDLVAREHRIFLDVKFHDIPNTVAKAAVEAARLGVWMFNVHATGGSEMMRKTMESVGEFCEKKSVSRPKIIAVTVLTSIDRQDLREIGVEREVAEQVLDLSNLTQRSGLDGVVASPHEVRAIRGNVGKKEFIIVTPGIRPAFATNDDQKRVMTPKEAFAAGSDYLVIGRPITQAADKLSAVEKILEEIGSK